MAMFARSPPSLAVWLSVPATTSTRSAAWMAAFVASLRVAAVVVVVEVPAAS